MLNFISIAPFQNSVLFPSIFLEAQNLNMKNKKAFLSAHNYGMKSDILRYEILHTYGGVYIDTDYECVINIGECNLYFLLHINFRFLMT